MGFGSPPNGRSADEGTRERRARAVNRVRGGRRVYINGNRWAGRGRLYMCACVCVRIVTELGRMILLYTYIFMYYIQCDEHIDCGSGGSSGVEYIAYTRHSIFAAEGNVRLFENIQWQRSVRARKPTVGQSRTAAGVATEKRPVKTFTPSGGRDLLIYKPTGVNDKLYKWKNKFISRRLVYSRLRVRPAATALVPSDGFVRVIYARARAPARLYT